MITKEQAAFAERRYGLKLPTWLDAQDLDTATAALARAVSRRLREVMDKRVDLLALVKQHAADGEFLLGFLRLPKEISATLAERTSLREAAERLADAEEQLEPLVLALCEATDEPHP